jgi:tRNA(Ile)-lysidine synthase
LVAASGGPDSTALLLMAADWARQVGRPPIFAATVDHGLRPDSAQEAETVAVWSAALGVPHQILKWDEKPTTRIQERAREARYALLEDCARRVDASILLTAHHADDQSETVLFRLARGSGVAGLAGMAQRTRRGDLLHLRPFLDVEKAALVAWCERQGHPWLTDPSNSDPRFARARLRAAASARASLGLTSDGLCRLARRAARADAALRTAYAAFLAEAVTVRSAERTALSRSALLRAPDEMLVRLACEESARLAGGAAPRLERAEAFVERLSEALTAGVCFRATLGGAIFDLNEDGLEMVKEQRSKGAGAAPTRRPRAVLLAHVAARSLVKGGEGA